MSEPKVNDRMEKIVSLCKRRGFIFQSSEIYGGINCFWDYGRLGAELKRNIKEYWWRSMTQLRDDVVGLEATIIMHPKIWEASGHTSTFSDPMVDCLLTKKRYRADQIEPQSGTAYYFSCAVDEDAVKALADLASAQGTLNGSGSVNVNDLLKSLADFAKNLDAFLDRYIAGDAADVIIMERLPQIPAERGLRRSKAEMSARVPHRKK